MKLSRRTVLRGLGVTIALPWLEAMSVPRVLASGRRSYTPGPAPKRLAFVYTPNGVIGDRWFPDTVGRDYELKRSLEPLAPHRDQMLMLSGLDRTYQAGADPHAQCGSCWLTSLPPNEQPDGLLPIHRTLDQVIADNVGDQTLFPSLELSCNSYTDNREPKCFDAISWYGPGHEAASEKDPGVVFQRLFGDAEPIHRSVLDTVLADAQSLRNELGQTDRRKLDEYLESVRSVERRMERIRTEKRDDLAIEMSPPTGIPNHRGEYIRLMCDLLVLAFQTDQTRVASFMVAPERWRTPLMFHGLFDKPVSHHEMTHDHEFDEEVSMIDRFHAEQLAYLIGRFKEKTEGDQSLLDSSLIVFGSGLGDGNEHSYKELPTILIGAEREGFQPGRHVACSPGTPLANLWLSVADQMGVPLDRFADSTERLTALS